MRPSSIRWRSAVERRSGDVILSSAYALLVCDGPGYIASYCGFIASVDGHKLTMRDWRSRLQVSRWWLTVCESGSHGHHRMPSDVVQSETTRDNKERASEGRSTYVKEGGPNFACDLVGVKQKPDDRCHTPISHLVMPDSGPVPAPPHSFL